jgi:hypothetical protein
VSLPESTTREESEIQKTASGEVEVIVDCAVLESHIDNNATQEALASDPGTKQVLLVE